MAHRPRRVPPSRLHRHAGFDLVLGEVADVDEVAAAARGLFGDQQRRVVRPDLEAAQDRHLRDRLEADVEPHHQPLADVLAAARGADDRVGVVDDPAVHLRAQPLHRVVQAELADLRALGAQAGVRAGAGPRAEELAPRRLLDRLTVQRLDGEVVEERADVAPAHRRLRAGQDGVVINAHADVEVVVVEEVVLQQRVGAEQIELAAVVEVFGVGQRLGEVVARHAGEAVLRIPPQVVAADDVRLLEIAVLVAHAHRRPELVVVEDHLFGEQGVELQGRSHAPVEALPV